MKRLIQPTDRWAVVDLETNGLLDEVTRIHCIVVRDSDGSVKSYFDSPEFDDVCDGSLVEGVQALERLDKVVMHNGLGFDLPVLRKFFPATKLTEDMVFDTIVVSRLLWPEIRQFDFARNKMGVLPGKLIGSHSLEAWGYRLGVLKGDFAKRDDWSTFSQEMLDYCEQDTAVTMALLQHLHSQNLSEKSVQLEHLFAASLERQARNGFAFDVERARSLAGELVAKRAELMQRLGSAFPPFVDHYETPKRKEKKVRTTAFNPQSRAHIARALREKYGWKPDPATGYNDNGSVHVDDDVLSALPWPEAKDLALLFTIGKRLGTLAEGDKSWLSNVRKDGRIASRAVHNGTITGRCTHKVVVNVPKPGVFMAEQFRSLFVAPPGRVLVGIDAKGLELRGLAHFLHPFDGGRFAKVVTEGDPHEANRVALGLDSRDKAKGFVYAMIYGAGDAKLGSLVGGGRKEGAMLRAKLMSGIPGFAGLLAHLERTLEARGMLHRGAWRVDVRPGAYLFGLDGRRLYLRGLHSALNTAIQGAGAVLMKQATVFMSNTIDDHAAEFGGDVLQVCHQHDEVQFECDEDDAHFLSGILLRCMEAAGTELKFKCPLAGEVKVGKNWKETH